MFQLQCLKELKQQEEQLGTYNEAEIARRLSVNRSTVSRCLRRSVENGILSDRDYGFTKKGNEILSYYVEIEQDLFAYFRKIGVEESACYQAVAGMLDAVDGKTIQIICQKEKMHMQYENIGDKGVARVTDEREWEIGDCLEYGDYDVDFSIYRQGKDEKKLSMADMGFEKPAVLHYAKEKSFLKLKIREVSAYSGANSRLLLHGHVQTVKCRYKDDGLKELPVVKGSVQIPMSEICFECQQEGEIRGRVQLTMTCSVGVVHMPESIATLVLRM